MPTSPSAKKRLRQTHKRTAANKAARSSLRTCEKKLLQAIEAGDRARAEALLPTLYQQLDKAAKNRVLHPNTAANHKSRFARKLKTL
jgi:small subunit ribosomal protein S20